MLNLTLACGPFFHEDAITISLVLFLVVKPLAYFAFIHAFRYRVSRSIPMPLGRAIGLTALRTGLGIGFVGVVALVLARIGNESLWVASWAFLYVERVFSWWFVGWWGAGLRGRRLFGWILSGTLINAAFDAAMVGGFFSGWLGPIGIVGGIALFILALQLVGRRESLRLRFSAKPLCRACGYDLTGNLSGRCPECGRVITAEARAAA